MGRDSNSRHQLLLPPLTVHIFDHTQAIANANPELARLLTDLLPPCPTDPANAVPCSWLLQAFVETALGENCAAAAPALARLLAPVRSQLQLIPLCVFHAHSLASGCFAIAGAARHWPDTRDGWLLPDPAELPCDARAEAEVARPQRGRVPVG